jgi:hypothetical protein
MVARLFQKQTYIHPHLLSPHKLNVFINRNYERMNFKYFPIFKLLRIVCVGIKSLENKVDVI